MVPQAPASLTDAGMSGREVVIALVLARWKRVRDYRNGLSGLSILEDRLL